MPKKKKEEQMIFTSPDGGETVYGEPLGGKGPKVLISKSNKATIEEECQIDNSLLLSVLLQCVWNIKACKKHGKSIQCY